MVNLPLTVAGLTEFAEFFVTQCGDEVILGLPYLLEHGFVINLENREVTRRGKRVPIYDESAKPVLSLVRTAHAIELGPNEEKLAAGSLKIRSEKNGIGAVFPVIKMTSESTVLIARTLCDIKPGYAQTAIRLYNSGEQSVQIPEGMVIGKVERVSLVKEVQDVAIPAGEQLPPHLMDLYARGSQNLSEKQQASYRDFLRCHSNVFSEGPMDIGRCNLAKHHIRLKDTTPIKIPARRMPREKAEEADRQVDELLKEGLISPSDSPFSAPLVMVKKKDGSYRMCVDYRECNAQTIRDAYPLPRISDTLNYLEGSKWFCSLDLTSGYNQIEMGEGKEYTAFACRKGLFHYNVMSFGLCNAPATFQRLMEKVLSNLLWTSCLVYLDDILVIGTTFEETLQRLDEVLKRLAGANLKLKPKKCSLFQHELEYLGHIVSGEGIKACPKKVKSVAEWPQPENLQQLKSFLGLVKYYARFVKDLADIAAPLHQLTHKGVPFVWSKACEVAFATLKTALTTSPILGYPCDGGEYSPRC